MISGRRGAAAAGALAVPAVLALGGCSGPAAPPEPVRAQPAVASAAPARPVPSVPAPARPAASATRDGALAFVDYFWRTYNHAYATWDIGPLRAASDRSCSVCAGVEADVQKLAVEGIRVSGYRMEAVSASAPGAVTPGAEVSATLRQTPGRALSDSGEATELPGFRSLHSTITVQWTGASWVVSAVRSDGDSLITW